MTEALIMMGGLGLAIGLVLAVAAQVVLRVCRSADRGGHLGAAGANCGGCGSRAASPTLKRSSPARPLRVLAWPAARRWPRRAAVLGVAVEAVEPNIAAGVLLRIEKADTKFVYHGLNDCRAAAL